MPRAAGLLAAAVVLVDRRPGPAFGLLLGDSLLLVAFGDLVGRARLLVGVFAAWHGVLRQGWSAIPTLPCAARFPSDVQRRSTTKRAICFFGSSHSGLSSEALRKSR